MRIIIYVLLGFLMVAGILFVYGDKQWHRETLQLVNKMEGIRQPVQNMVYDASELENLPAPVERYLRTVLRSGQPLIGAVHLEQTGQFRMDIHKEDWQQFQATQQVITDRPGFIWDARIKILPAVSAYVRDAYFGCKGILQAGLWGLIPVGQFKNTREMAEGELMRFLAEAPWYPTVLLPGHDVTWKAVSDSSAQATLLDGDCEVSLLFRFNQQGLVRSVRADYRGRQANGKVIPTPWEGRWSRYELREGMLVPVQGEVAWLLPEERKPYWRGQLKEIDYEMTMR